MDILFCHLPTKCRIPITIDYFHRGPIKSGSTPLRMGHYVEMRLQQTYCRCYQVWTSRAWSDRIPTFVLRTRPGTNASFLETLENNGRTTESTPGSSIMDPSPGRNWNINLRRHCYTPATLQLYLAYEPMQIPQFDCCYY